MLVTREVILAKLETTYNTDALPSASADAILVENPAWSNEGARMTERPAIRSSLGKLPQMFGETLRTITFDVELKGAGAAYSASVKPEIGVLLRGCGLSETVDATIGAEKVTYGPASAGHESLTIYYYQDGTLIALTGARGNASFALAGGVYGKISFTFTGHTATATDAALPVPSYNSTVPAPFINAGFSVGGFAAVISTLNFDLTNTLDMPIDVNSADGFGQIRITARDVNGTFDPEYELVATKAWESEWRSGILMALTTGEIGTTQYNKYKIDMPAIAHRDIAPGARGGIRTITDTFGAHEATTDDEISLEFS